MRERGTTSVGGSIAGRSARAVLLLGALSLIVLACSKEEAKPPANGEVDASGFVLESATEIGPNAFTPPVDNPEGTKEGSTTPSCDKAAFVKDLQARPEALREWAKVLNMPESEVPAYVQTLQPMTLASDFKVTNHGLKDGVAYPRASILGAGTAVLVDPGFPSKGPTGPPPTFRPVSTTTTTTATTSTTRPSTTTTKAGQTTTTTTGVGFPVTRCKCGNPLLPAPLNGTPPSNGTFPPGTLAPGTTTRGGGGGTTTPTRPTSSTSSTRPSGSSSTSVPSSSTTQSNNSTTTSGPKPTITIAPVPSQTPDKKQ